MKFKLNLDLNEIHIAEYRRFYGLLTPLTIPGSKLLPNLIKLTERYHNYVQRMKAHQLIRKEEFLTFEKEINALVKSSFPPTFVEMYNQNPKSQPATPNMIIHNIALTIVIHALAELGKHNMPFPPDKIAEHEYKSKLLVQALDCIQHYGLHPLISKRPDSRKKYHLIIEPSKRSEIKETLFSCNLSHDSLIYDYVVPVQQEKKIYLNGYFVRDKDILKISVTSTKLKDIEVPLFKASKNIQDDLQYAKMCHVENQIMKGDYSGTRPVVIQSGAVEMNKFSTEGFIDHLVNGIEYFQSTNNNHALVEAIKQGALKNESQFRDYFQTWFKSVYGNVVPECRKGNDRIDLVIEHHSFGKKKIEFKGWWNNDKKDLPQQLYKYLTDFESEGFVFMINHLKETDVTEKYKKMVLAETLQFVPNSWETHKYKNTGFTYFSSRHKFGNKEKTIFHFIYRLHP